MNRIGIDIGGTFTDICIMDELTGEVRVAKTPSTAFRAKKQKTKLLSILKKIDGLSGVELLSISIDEKKY